MTHIPLDVALAALGRQLAGGLPIDIGGGAVQVELAVVARTEADEVTWALAEPADLSTHRLRFAVNVRPPDSTRDPAPYDDEIPIGEALDSIEDDDYDLPPITKPKPGVDGGHRDR